MPKRCLGCMKIKEKSPVCEHCGYNENVPNYPHQLPIGTVLKGQYTVGKVLGQGGFGITYIGWDNSLETPVAIKEYYPGSFVNRDCGMTLSVSCNGEGAENLFRQNRERFLKEAKILAKLQNVPGIVRVQNLFGENNTAYIIMEYVEGIDLKHYIRMQNRVLTVQETFSVLRPVMYALSKVHEAELVHRDISPDNIMILPDGTAKLLDFGAAREVENAEVNKELPQSTEAILKHGFAPMEQYRRRGSLGPWTDVYALCATMYYCLTGRVPNSAPERIMGDDNVNWRQSPGLSEEQITTLERGLAIMPENRIRTMKELYSGLFGQTTVTQSAPKKAETPAKPASYPTHTVSLEEEKPAERVMETKPKKKKPVGVLIAAVLAVAAIAAGAFFLKPGESNITVELPEILPAATETTQAITLSAEELQYREAEALAAEGKHAHAGIAFAKLGDYEGARERSFEQWSYTRKMKTIAVGTYYPYYRYILAVKNDGTAVAVGNTSKGECDISHWTDIVEVCAIDGCSIGLKADGTLVFNKGYELYFPEFKEAESWTDIVSIYDCGSLVGLKADGTVLAIKPYGYDTSWPYGYEFTSWTDIVSLFPNRYNNTVMGLKADGTVCLSYTCWADTQLQDFYTDVWTDIVSIDTDGDGFSAVKADGSVLTAAWVWNGETYEFSTEHLSQYDNVVEAMGSSYYENGYGYHHYYLLLKDDGTVEVYPKDTEWSGKETINGLSGIKSLYNETDCVLKTDGTVISLYGNMDVSDWTDIVELIWYSGGAIGLRSDGTVLITETSSAHIKNTVESWTDIRLPAPRKQP